MGKKKIPELIKGGIVDDKTIAFIQDNEEENHEFNINLKHNLATQFKLIKHAVTKDRGKKATNVDVMIALFKTMVEKKAIESRMKSLKFNHKEELKSIEEYHKKEKEKLQSEISELNANVMKILQESVNRPPPPVIVNVGALAQSNITPTLSPPPTPPRLPPKHIVPISNNIKQDLQGELNSVFNGDIPKPSDVLAMVVESEKKEEKPEEEKEEKEDE